MPIEIKELHIKINVEEKSGNKISEYNNDMNIKELKSDIVKRCTRNVLEILKEKQER